MISKGTGKGAACRDDADNGSHKPLQEPISEPSAIVLRCTDGLGTMFRMRAAGMRAVGLRDLGRKLCPESFLAFMVRAQSDRPLPVQQPCFLLDVARVGAPDHSQPHAHPVSLTHGT